MKKLFNQIQNNQRLSLSLLFIFGFIILSFGIGSYALLDLDEPRYAQAAKEMIARQDYIVPYFNNTVRYDKPILFYWAEILSFQVFGISEWAARLPSVLAALGVLYFGWLLKRSQREGLIIVLILMTSIEFFVLSRLSVTDMLLNFCICGALVSFFQFTESRSERLLYLSALFMGLGTLCKGPVAILVPSIIIGVFLIYTSQLMPLAKSNLRALFNSILLFLGTTLPWYIAVHYATQGKFTEIFFVKHNLARFSGTLSGHDQAWYFYLVVIFFGAMPWTLFLVQALKKKLNKLDFFCLIWILSFVFFYSSAGTKLINYIIPVYLPIAVLVGAYINKNLQSKILRVIYFSTTILGLILVIISQLKWSNFIKEEFVLQCLIPETVLWLGFLLIVIGIILQCLINSKPELSFYLFIATLITILLWSVLYIIEPLAEFKSSGIKRFARLLPRGSILHSIKIERPGFNFYTENQVQISVWGDLKSGDYFVAKKGSQMGKNTDILLEDNKYLFGIIK